MTIGRVRCHGNCFEKEVFECVPELRNRVETRTKVCLEKEEGVVECDEEMKEGKNEKRNENKERRMKRGEGRREGQQERV